ncbi:hypothetical protein [Actinomadura flavalba]|uniref:hypothetical protein n=1 Tax=Actinomadura flavalba TaxID=1120938 RepID=UPI00036184F9|nr:hypothetical protein [Actinomadura flavalba]
MTAQWTRAALEDLGPVTDVPTTADVLDVDPWTVYEQIRRGTWDLTRVLRLGRKIKIPTHDLVTLLYPSGHSAAGPSASPAAATNTNPPAQEGSHAHERTGWLRATEG